MAKLSQAILPALAATAAIIKGIITGEIDSNIVAIPVPTAERLPSIPPILNLELFANALFIDPIAIS